MVANCVIDFLCLMEKLDIFIASKYNLSFPIVISSHLVLLSKLVGYSRRKSVLQTVRKFSGFEPFGVKGTKRS